MAVPCIGLPRRRFLQATIHSLLAGGTSGWLPWLAAASLANEDRSQHDQARQDVGNDPRASSPRTRQCILLWMPGGPSQLDTFDMKPRHKNGGEFAEIATRVPGIRFSEHLPRLAERADKLNLVRSVSAREGDHQRATYLMRTGQSVGQPVDYPSISSLIAKLLADDSLSLPPYVSLGRSLVLDRQAFGPGFLGARFGPLALSQSAGNPTDDFPTLRLPLDPSRSDARASRRRDFWSMLQDNYVDAHDTEVTNSHDAVYRRAFELSDGSGAEAFDLAAEPQRVRELYGRSLFGQSCLLARRLIEAGVPMVEVTLGSGAAWDTHVDNFTAVRSLSEELDAGWSALLDDLALRGLLETTTILWMGEFGRTPQINATAGRDHFPNASTCVFAGGGIKTGHVVGATSSDGTQVVDAKVAPADVLATLLSALDISPTTQLYTPSGRPLAASDGTPINEVLA